MIMTRREEPPPSVANAGVTDQVFVPARRTNRPPVGRAPHTHFTTGVNSSSCRDKEFSIVRKANPVGVLERNFEFRKWLTGDIPDRDSGVRSPEC